MDMSDVPTLTVRDLTQYIPVSPCAIYQRCKRGTFPRPTNITGGMTHGYRWSVADVNAWLVAHSMPPIPETDPTAEGVRNA